MIPESLLFIVKIKQIRFETTASLEKIPSLLRCSQGCQGSILLSCTLTEQVLSGNEKEHEKEIRVKLS